MISYIGFISTISHTALNIGLEKNPNWWMCYRKLQNHISKQWLQYQLVQCTIRGYCLYTIQLSMGAIKDRLWNNSYSDSVILQYVRLLSGMFSSLLKDKSKARECILHSPASYGAAHCFAVIFWLTILQLFSLWFNIYYAFDFSWNLMNILLIFLIHYYSCCSCTFKWIRYACFFVQKMWGLNQILWGIIGLIVCEKQITHKKNSMSKYKVL